MNETGPPGRKGTGHTWIVFGDSHVGPIEHASQAGWIDRPCEIVWVAGATSVGLRNPNSATNAIKTFREHLIPMRSDAIPVVQLGEVDCGFVIWWRAAHHGESIETQLRASIDACMAFVDELLAAGYPAVVITGATLPTIRDGQDWGEIANKRRDVTASLVERTQLTLRYNEFLRVEAAKRSCPFIDITSLTLDPATGTVADAFRCDDPNDHHLHAERGGMVWARALNQVSIGDEARTTKAADLRRRRLPLYLIGSGFLLLLAAEVWVKLR